MSVTRWAPDNAEGMHAYVKSTTSWGRTDRSIVYAENLATAKRKYGWTSMAYTTVTVRRAKPEDTPTARQA